MGELLTNHHGVEVEAVESMEMAPGVNPLSGRVPEQELLTPETCRRRRRRLGCFCRIWRICLGLLRRGDYIGERAASEGSRGAHTTPWRGRRWARARAWCGSLVAPLRLPFGLRVRDEIIRSLLFVPSNSENIFLSTFLKRKNSRKQELALWHLVNRLVLENA